MKSIAGLLLLSSSLCSRSSAYTLEYQNYQRPIADALLSSPRTNPPPRPYSPPSYRDALLSLHKDLIEIPSVTDNGDEDKAAYFLVDYLTQRGYATQLQSVPPRPGTLPDIKRFNLLAWPGAGTSSATIETNLRKPRVLVTSHIDVVPPWIPYSTDAARGSEIGPDTVIRGRGSVDAKGSVAAQVTAVEELLAAGEVGPEDLMLLYVVGEETTGDGMKNFSAWWREGHAGFEFDAAIFGEPTGNKLACGHKGITGGWLRAKGKAGHSGYPELGKSATELLMRALVKILDTDLGSSERFGNTTVNVGRLMGGVAGNVIAKDAGALLTVRIAAGNFTSGPEIVREKVDKILKEMDEDAFSYEFPYAYGPVECDCDVPGECPLRPHDRRREADIFRADRIRDHCRQLRDGCFQPKGEAHELLVRPRHHPRCARR